MERAGNTKRLLAVPVMMALAGAVACAPDPARPSTQEREIREAVATMLEDGWSRGQVDVFDRTMADSLLFHYASTPPRVMTREESNAVVLAWREAFPDLRMRADQVIVQGDLAAVRATLTGTHQGPWSGAEPTGQRVRMSLMMFMRFEDGRLVELWESDDQVGLRRQLGLIP